MKNKLQKVGIKERKKAKRKKKKTKTNWESGKGEKNIYIFLVGQNNLFNVVENDLYHPHECMWSFVFIPLLNCQCHLSTL